MSNTELVLSPADFVAISNQALEFALPFVTIEGELSEFKIRKNQWLYFKVKDDFASVDCFGTIYMMPGPLEDGMKVRVSGRPKLHEKFGFSFQTQSIQPAGEGSIKKAFDMLLAKLEAEGLFEESRKRSLPYPPQRISVLTSKEGAAIGDFQKILTARWPFIDIDVVDVFVQGEKAAESVTNAINEVNKSSTVPQVIVVIRGGGSAEDLSAFNDERVVRAVASSRIPTLVAIGHEQDISLAELAADKRASTPSNAAELLTPDINNELKELGALKMTVASLIAGLSKELSADISAQKDKLSRLFSSLLDIELIQIKSYRRNLDLLDPKNVLKRGYAMVKGRSGLIRSASSTTDGQDVSLVFYDGSKRARIEGNE